MEDSVSFAPNASGKKSCYRKLEGEISDLSKRIRDNVKILDSTRYTGRLRGSDVYSLRGATTSN